MSSSSDQQYPYPYPYDPQQPPQPQQPQAHQAPQAPQHWPDGTAGQSALAQEPGGYDQGATQTWQAPTWDTQYQPVIQRNQRNPEPYEGQGQAHGQAQGQSHGQFHGQAQGYGQQPDAYGAAQSDPFATGSQQSGPFATGSQRSAPYATGSQQSAPYATGPQQSAPYATGPQQSDPYGTPQPHAPYQQPQHHQPQYQQPHQEPQPYRPGPDTGSLLPQGASGSLPLPPEVPATPAPAPAARPEPAPAAEPPDARPEQQGQPSQPGPDDSGYSAPTTLGNVRITDAQRARAEGRSPVIAPGTQPAAITAGLGLLLAGGAAVGSYALLVPLVLLQAVTAAGWFRLNGMWPARQGIALAFAGGLVADVALLAAGREHGPAALLGTLGVWVLLTVVLQLRSHAGADERMYGLMATVVSAALAVLAAGHLAAVPDAVTVGGVAVAAAVLVRALPLPGPVSVVGALLAGAGAGAVVGGFTEYGAQGALLGLAAGGCALIGLRVASYDYPSRFVHMTAGVALPLTAAAPAVYLIGRALA
ncbi:hypothetical protein [Streptomyces sp. NPDC007346]|uniref:hypothetical protein n=1 Tax=Streptomyces sp. NPDC007346 TaxID=3154682 RepID=UPI003451380C